MEKQLDDIVAELCEAADAQANLIAELQQLMINRGFVTVERLERIGG